MSYTITRKKRVVTIDASFDPRFGTFPHLALFLEQSSANNVRPQTFEWTVLGATSDDRSAPNSWAGNIELPTRLWERAAAADMGSIQPRNVTTSGLDYIKSWKKAAAAPLRLPVADGPLLWRPELTVWDFPTLKDRIHEDEHALAVIASIPWRKGHYADQRTFTPENRTQFLDALLLWLARKSTPTGSSIYLQADEDDTFLTQNAAHVPQFAAA